MFPCQNVLLHDVARRQAPDRAPVPLAALGHRGACSPTCARWTHSKSHHHPGPIPLRHVPRMHEQRRAVHVGRPTASPPYCTARHPPPFAHAATMSCIDVR
jgi:hypothetical protein